jgi:Tfp pilus assembly protein PilV
MNLTPASARRQAGISVVEVVIASSILIVAIVPILKAMTTAQVTGRIVERKTMSLALAQGKLSEIQAKSVHDFDSSYDETDTALATHYLCNVSDSESGILKTVSVSVGFDLNGNNSLASNEVMVTLTTLLAKKVP